jgi:hypothetical protein
MGLCLVCLVCLESTSCPAHKRQACAGLGRLRSAVGELTKSALPARLFQENSHRAPLVATTRRQADGTQCLK